MSNFKPKTIRDAYAHHELSKGESEQARAAFYAGVQFMHDMASECHRLDQNDLITQCWTIERELAQAQIAERIGEEKQ